MVGPEGRAIGVDMTPSMIERARTNAKTGGYTNVEFYQSTIDRIPLRTLRFIVSFPTVYSILRRTSQRYFAKLPAY